MAGPSWCILPQWWRLRHSRRRKDKHPPCKSVRPAIACHALAHQCCACWVCAKDSRCCLCTPRAKNSHVAGMKLQVQFTSCASSCVGINTCNTFERDASCRRSPRGAGLLCYLSVHDLSQLLTGWEIKFASRRQANDVIKLDGGMGIDVEGLMAAVDVA
jgi:hypothetical protein